jgi:hypothetical protein
MGAIMPRPWPLRQVVQAQPEATMEALCNRLQLQRGLAGQCGLHVPHAKASGHAAKQKSLHTYECEPLCVQQSRTASRQRIAARDRRQLACVDESGWSCR